MSSLLLAGLIETIGDEVDPWVKLVRSMGDAYTRGYAAPDTSEIERMLDGERVVGGRSHNRLIVLPLRIDGVSRVDVGARIDLICQIVNAESFPLEWTPTGGLTTVHDCSWGTAEPQEIGTEEVEGLFRGGVLLHLPAAAFGRSRDLQFVEVNAGAAAQVQLDGMNGGSFTGGPTVDPGVHWEGVGSLKGTLIGTLDVGPAGHHNDIYAIGTFGRGLPGGAVDLSGYLAVSNRFRWPAPAGGTWSIQIAHELLSGGVPVSGATRTVYRLGGDRRFQRLSFPIRETDDVSAVDGWRITGIQGVLKAKDGRPSTSDFWVDDLRALPSASALNTTAEGALLLVPNVLGSARAPVNLVFSEPA